MKTVSEVHSAFDAHKTSPVELTSEFLVRARKSRLNAFITLCEDRALAQAKVCQEQFKSHGRVPREEFPLFGVPIGIKDVIVMDGVRTTCGSLMLENYIPPYTATAVERLERAGAIILGKLNCDEFAMGSSNENSAFGPVAHPTHPGYVSGGSSGGPAAAVAGGLCVASLGTDTGGSIRLPASFCGVVGFKPTYGRVSRSGLIAFASSLDQIGPFASTVEDCARMLDVMAGPDLRDSTSSQVPKGSWVNAISYTPEWNKIRVGIPKEYFIGGLAPAVQKAIEASLNWFRSKGAKLVELSLPHTQYSVATYYVVAVSEASSNLARFDGVRFGMRPREAADVKDLLSFYKKSRSRFGAEVKRRIILGTFALSSGYYDAFYRRACQVRRLIRDDFNRAFEKVDVIASPVSPTTAFKIGQKSKDPLEMYLNDVFTIPASLAGLPALSVPCGKDAEALPIGLHLIAPHFAEESLFSIARGFEKEFSNGS